MFPALNSNAALTGGVNAAKRAGEHAPRRTPIERTLICEQRVFERKVPVTPREDVRSTGLHVVSFSELRSHGQVHRARSDARSIAICRSTFLGTRKLLCASKRSIAIAILQYCNIAILAS